MNTWSEKILRKEPSRRGNDYAVFEIDLDNRKYDEENSIYGLSGRVKESVNAVEGMKVQKVGQRTGRTYGIVKSVSSRSITIVPKPDKEQGEISMGGDSGALWVTDEKDFKAVSLHTAGEKDDDSNRPDVVFAVPMRKVLNGLLVRF